MKQINPAVDPKRVVVLNDVLTNLVSVLNELEGIEYEKDAETVRWVSERALLFGRLGDMFNTIELMSNLNDARRKALYEKELPDVIKDVRNLAQVMLSD